MHNFKQLDVWNRGIKLSSGIYNLIISFPIKDQKLLSSQMFKAAYSIPSNIAEGAGKNSVKDFCRFLSIAEGSSFELETQLIVSKEILPDKKEPIEFWLDELIIIQKMLYRLRKSMEDNSK